MSKRRNQAYFKGFSLKGVVVVPDPELPRGMALALTAAGRLIKKMRDWKGEIPPNTKRIVVAMMDYRSYEQRARTSSSTPSAMGPMAAYGSRAVNALALRGINRK